MFYFLFLSFRSLVTGHLFSDLHSGDSSTVPYRNARIKRREGEIRRQADFASPVSRLTNATRNEDERASEQRRRAGIWDSMG